MSRARPQLLRNSVIYRRMKRKVKSYSEELYLNTVKHKSPFAFEESFVPTKRTLRYLELTNLDLYNLALETLNEQRYRRPDLLHPKVYRHKEPASLFRYGLLDLITRLSIVPVDPIPEIHFKAGYSIIVIRNRDNFEFQILDKGSNYLKSIHCRTDLTFKGSFSELYKNLLYSRPCLKSENGKALGEVLRPFLL